MTTATATCYRQVSGLIQPESGWVICPKSYQGLCCQTGSECLDEQICHNPKSSIPGGSGYYIGLCTDATYKSSSCSSRCTDDTWGDVIYNSSTNLWACCGTNESCDHPTNGTFLAPSPQQLLAAASSASATSAATASSQPAATIISTNISGATVTITSTPSAKVDQKTSSLDGGAKAGIGVGAAVAAVAIIALLAWIIRLRKRLRSHGEARYLEGRGEGRGEGNVVYEGPPRDAQEIAVPEHELVGYLRPHEMDGR